MNIGDRIKKVRKSLDLTQEAFATRIRLLDMKVDDVIRRLR